MSPWLRAKTVLRTAEMSLPLKPWRRWWMVNPGGKALILFFSPEVRIKRNHVGACLPFLNGTALENKTGKQREELRQKQHTITGFETVLDNTTTSCARFIEGASSPRNGWL